MEFEAELRQLLNKHSAENKSGTPDFILATFMFNCLEAFNDAINMREKWYNREQDEFGMPKGYMSL